MRTQYRFAADRGRRKALVDGIPGASEAGGLATDDRNETAQSLLCACDEHRLSIQPHGT